MVKRGIGRLLFLFLVVFLLAFVSSACVSSDDLIMRISSSSNAHAEVWNGGGNYPVEICYNDFFGSYSGSNPHQCTGSNNVLSISSSTNAHSEDPTVGNYGTDVCYGDLKCKVVWDGTQTDGCTIDVSNDGTVIARLSGASSPSSSNAHIEDSVSKNYGWEVCCKKAYSVFWSSDTSGTPISTARPDTTVYAFAPNWPVATSNSETGNNFPSYNSNWCFYDDDDGSLGFSSSDQQVPGLCGVNDMNSNWNSRSSGDDYYYAYDIIGAIKTHPQNIIELGTSGSGDPPVDMYFTVGGYVSNPLLVTYCGDYFVDSTSGWELCDLGPSSEFDGNPGNGDVCTNALYEVQGCKYCGSDCYWAYVDMPVCGDGVVDDSSVTGIEAEECDDGAGNLASSPCELTGGCTYCTAGQGPGFGDGCQLVTVPALGEVYWARPGGNPIPDGGTALIGDWVELRYSLPPSGLSQFDIYEKDTFLGIPNYDEKDAGSSAIIDPVGTYMDKDGDGTNDVFIAYWQISEEDVEAVNDDGDGLNDFVEFYFDIGSKTSEELRVSIIPPEDDGGDELELNLLSPVCGTEIPQGTSSSIKFEVSDTDDLIKFNVKVNEEVKFSTSDLSGSPEWTSGGTFEYPHTFSDWGTANVRIEVENTNGEKESVVSNVIVKETQPGPERTYIAACISKPENFEEIQSDSAEFDTQGTKVLKFGGGTDENVLVDNPEDVRFIWELSDGRKFSKMANEAASQKGFIYFLNKGDNWMSLQIEVV